MSYPCFRTRSDVSRAWASLGEFDTRSSAASAAFQVHADTALRCLFMKRRAFILLVVTGLLQTHLFALSATDETALRELTRDYASWDYSGRPVRFRERLDYDSYEEQRRILLLLAGRGWNGFWGDYWRRRGVGGLAALRALPPREFWLRYHSGLEADAGGERHASGRVSVDIHAVTEVRGLAYVVYQVKYAGHRTADEGSFHVLRARRIGGEWRLVAFPRITEKLRRQLGGSQ